MAILSVLSSIETDGAQSSVPLPVDDKGRYDVLSIDSKVVASEDFETNKQAPLKRVDVPVVITAEKKIDDKQTPTTTVVYAAKKNDTTGIVSFQMASKMNPPSFILTVDSKHVNTTNTKYNLYCNGTAIDKDTLTITGCMVKSASFALINHAMTGTIMALVLPMLGLIKINKMFVL